MTATRRVCPLNLEVTRSDESSALIVLSSASFALVLVLVLATPFVEMSGLLNQEQRAYRLYGYGLLGLLQVALAFSRGWRRSVQIFSTPVLVFLLWCALSLTWTQHVDLTVKRLVLLLLIYSGIFSGVCDLGTKRSFNILRALLVVTLIVNFAAVFTAPDIGMHVAPAKGLWRGVMANKNIAGMLCAITIILFSFESSRISVPGRLAVLAGAFVFFYQAWSKTAWISLPIALAAGGMILLIGHRYRSSHETIRKILVVGSRALFSLVITGLALMTLQQEFFLSLTDNTTAVTMRAAIWRPMIQFYLGHPILGSGYGAYWDASDNLVDSRAFNLGMWKDVDQGHNGYLDLLVQVGLPGLALALYAAVLWSVAQLAPMIGRTPQRAALVFSLIVFLLLENLSESSLFADDALGNATLFIALAQLHRIRLRSRGGRRTTLQSRRGLPAEVGQRKVKLKY
jgi:exopolysaccharide production protein ExoQ